jgi:hypothetical protein
MGGLMSNFMEKPTVYQNPANLSNQYAMGGNMYGNGGGPRTESYDNPFVTQDYPQDYLGLAPVNSPYRVNRYNQRYLSTPLESLSPLGPQTQDPANQFAGPNMENGQFATGYPMVQGIQGINPYITPQYPAQNMEKRTPNYDPQNMYGDDWEDRVDTMSKEGYPMTGYNDSINPKGYSDYYFQLNPANTEEGVNNMYYSDPIQTSEDMVPPVKTSRYIDPYNQGAYNEMSQKRLPLSNPFTTLAPINNANRITQFSPTPTEQELANYSKQMQGTSNPAQNEYPEVGNTGYLTNLAGNLVKAGMVATSKPPIYNPSVKFGRMNANPAERLAMQEGRREIQGTKDIIRNNATSSGQYLTNASLMGSSAANKLAGTIGGIRQQYDTQNVGIGNQEAQLNQAITSGNNLAKETFRDNRLNQYNKILDSVIGANQQRFATDEHANNFQNQVISLLKTGVYHYGKVDEKGMYEILGPNGEVITKMPKVS